MQKKPRHNPPKELLVQKYRYESGQLFNIKTGNRAGTLHSSGRYRVIVVDKVSYPEENIVWVLHGNFVKNCVIAHINGNRLDNRIENLYQLPVHAKSYPSPKSKTKIPGISWSSFHNGWIIHLTLRTPAGKPSRKFIGTAESLDEAKHMLNQAHIHYTKLNYINDDLPYRKSVEKRQNNIDTMMQDKLLGW